MNPLARIEDWARPVDGTGERWGRDVATSTSGAVVLVGAFDAAAVFDAGLPSEMTLVSTGGWNSYIAVYEEDGEFDWALPIHGEDVYVQAVAMDDRRSIAVAGYTSGSAIFQFQNGLTQTVSPPPGAIEVGFVAVFDSDGDLSWVQPLLGDLFVQALDVDFRRDGSVVVGGIFQGTAFLGETPVDSVSPQGFVLEYTRNGALLFELETSSVSGESSIWSVACFDGGDVLIAGDFQGTVALGDQELVSEAGSGDVFCARISPGVLGDGVVWVNRLGGPAYDTVYAADVSERGDVALAGAFEETTEVGQKGGVPFFLTAHSLQDAFVAAFDEDGVLRWANVIGGSGVDSAFAAGLSKDGNVVVTGSFGDDLDLGVGHRGRVLFDPPSGGRFDAFLAYYDSDGVLHTAYRYTGGSQEFGMGAVVSDRGALVASGAATSETQVLGLFREIATVQVTGDRGAYVVHIDPALLVERDVDGDGHVDIVVGARKGGASAQGTVHVFFGPTFAPVADLVITGEAANDDFGGALDASGDLNGDFIDDIVVGARAAATPDALDGGTVYVFFGRRDRGFPTTAASADLVIDGDTAGTGGFGQEVVVGDLDGDGVDDLVASDPSFDDSNGRVYVFYGVGGTGPQATSASQADDVLSGLGGSLFGGAANTIYDGPGSLAIGDLNGDGIADLAVGSVEVGPSGSVHVFYGGSAGVGTRTIAGADVSIDGSRGSISVQFGSALMIGDFDGDGDPDLGVGDSDANDLGILQGAYFVFFGPVVGALGGDDADAIYRAQPDGEDFGSEAAFGDLDGDGFLDLVVGDEECDDPVDGAGAVYVFFGPDLTSTDAASAGVVITGTDAISHETVGRALAVGDLDDDGIDDLVIGAEVDSGVNSGRAYVFYGRRAWIGTTTERADDTLEGGLGDSLFGCALSR